MNVDAKNRVLDQAEQALPSTSSGRRQSETLFLQQLFRELGGHVSAVGLSPAELFRAALHNGPLMRSAQDLLRVLAMPSQRPESALRAGDWMVRAVPGAGDVGHVSVLASAELLTPSALASEGIAAESVQPGYYGLVIEAGVFPHGRSRPFARRVLDSRGCALPNTVILRPRYLEVKTRPKAPYDEPQPDYDEGNNRIENRRLDSLLLDMAEKTIAGEESSIDEQVSGQWTRCFSATDIVRVEQAYKDNASAANAKSGDRSSCIVMLNVALGQLLSLPLKSNRARGTSARIVQMGNLTTESIEKAMKQLVDRGYALAPTEINFFDRRNRTAGTLKPERLKASVQAKVLALADTEGCWFAFGMSIMDGYHSVLLLVDCTATAAKIYWLDQFSSGMTDDVTSSLDQRITDKTQSWWQAVMDTRGKGYNTTIRLWPLRKEAKQDVEATVETPTGTKYNRSAAVEYARKFWNIPCDDQFVALGSSSGKNFEKVPAGTKFIHEFDSGGNSLRREHALKPDGSKIEFKDLDDCTHFISCCIGERPGEPCGGLQIPYKQLGAPPTAPYGIVRVGTMVDFLVGKIRQDIKYAEILAEKSEDDRLISSLQAGDLIAYFNKRLQRYSHMTLYLGANKIACHTYCRSDNAACTWDNDWDLGRGTHKWTFIRFVV